jgi:hypothetical protein
MAALTPDEQASTYRLLSETTRDRLLAQRDSIDRIETKGTVLLGFAIAIAQLYVTQSDAVTELRVLAFVGFALAVVFGLFVVRPYEHRYPPEPLEFCETFLEVRSLLIDKWLGAARAEAFEANVLPAKRKERFYWLTLAALIGAAVVSVVSLTL